MSLMGSRTVEVMEMMTSHDVKHLSLLSRSKDGMGKGFILFAKRFAG